MRRLLAMIVALAAVAASCPARADGDAAAGKTVFKKCAACHTTEPTNRVGPTLSGIVGRPVASVADFKYSKAMVAFSDGGKVWSEAELSDYLVAPRSLVKGTSMAFAGLKKPEDIANLIAFLKDPTAAP
ncbi:cytochrome c family protein [Rhizobium sp. TRM95111]|uniref:c-type cytochrome n=1 Tax=Rhizobium alarense TaxID=2846851 RepID=UPI001F2596EE|nr:cytochrome c family protein [Rhizobium alarense]MCF3642384.1 cytochrome c family protein [Rhizobium alarense]